MLVLVLVLVAVAKEPAMESALLRPVLQLKCSQSILGSDVPLQLMGASQRCRLHCYYYR